MPRFLPDELRLLLAVVMNVGVLVAALRFARRATPGNACQALADAFLIFYLIQYLSVTLPGVLGLLNVWTIVLLAGGMVAALEWGTRRLSPAPSVGPAPRQGIEQWAVIGSGLLVVSFVLGITTLMRGAPVMANDALTYHIPAAVEWLHSGRLGLYEAWFYNPANSYSPLAGSVFITWLVAPMGNDVLARFVQAPAVVMVFAVMLQLFRAAGMKPAAAAVLAAAVACSRPVINQTHLPKDDLFVAAFFASAVNGLTRQCLRDRLGPWRVGIAIGLMLATKYTALMSLPLLLLMADAPHRAGWHWRDYATAIGAAALLAGPWFVRNLILTGNPLYPTNVSLLGVRIFEGMFTPVRSDRLRSLEGVWKTFTGGYYSAPPLVWAWLVPAWIATIVLWGRRALSDPLARLCVIGAPLGMLIFIFTSPYAEIRFTYPSLLLLFTCLALAAGALPDRPAPQPAAFAAALLLLGCALGTSFIPPRLADLAPLIGTALLLTAALAVAWLPLTPRGRAGLAGAVAFVSACVVYVQWPVYLRDYRQIAPVFWSADAAYGATGIAWQYIRESMPRDATLAYANLYYVQPLYGFELDRRITYAPTRRGIDSFVDLPPLAGPMTGEELPEEVVQITTADSDAETWLANLRARGATHLIVGKIDLADPPRPAHPPELTFIAAHADRFEKQFENDAAVVYAIRDPAR